MIEDTTNEGPELAMFWYIGDRLLSWSALYNDDEVSIIHESNDLMYLGINADIGTVWDRLDASTLTKSYHDDVFSHGYYYYPRGIVVMDPLKGVRFVQADPNIVGRRRIRNLVEKAYSLPPRTLFSVNKTFSCDPGSLIECGII